jgi:hypothetical protein
VTNYIYETLQSKYGLNRIQIPFDSDDRSGLKSFIFFSQDFWTNTDKCVVMIHGSGAVRAGQWARSVCINDGLNTGSVFPFVEQA